MSTETDLLRLFPGGYSFGHLEQHLTALGARDVVELQIDVIREQVAASKRRVVFISPSIEAYVSSKLVTSGDGALRKIAGEWRNVIRSLVALKNDYPRQVILVALGDCARAGRSLPSFLGLESFESATSAGDAENCSALPPVELMCQLLISEQLGRDEELLLEIRRLNLAFTPMRDGEGDPALDKSKLDIAVELARGIDRLYRERAELERELANAEKELGEMLSRCRAANKNSIAAQEMADGHRTEAQRLSQELSDRARKHSETVEEYSTKLVAASRDKKNLAVEVEKLRTEFGLRSDANELRLSKLTAERDQLEEQFAELRLKLERSVHASELLESERNQLAEHLVQMKTSNSWKLTAPVRVIMAKIRHGASDGGE